jgi:hypothetical protein
MRSSAVKKRTIIGASLVCGLTIAAMLGAAVPSAQTQSGQSALRAGSAGVTVRLPRGWRTYPNGVAPRSMPYNDPLVRIVVASTQVRAFPRGCKAETFRFARGGVGLMVVEWLRPQRGVTWTQRPRPFMARALSVRPAPAVECWPGPAGAVEFTANGRYFAAYLLLDEHAPLAKAAQARAVLDTLQVARRP